MNISKKALVGIVLVSIVCATALTYALIETQWVVKNHLKILGGAIELWQWEEGETYSATYETDDIGGVIPGESRESPQLVLAIGSDTSIDQVITYNTTLPSDVGYILWQVEVSIFLGGGEYGWKWFNWTESQITVDFTLGQTIYLPGTPNNQIQPLQKIGLRPEQVPLSAGLIGHFKYTVYTYQTAPCADYPFDIVVTGTETP